MNLGRLSVSAAVIAAVLVAAAQAQASVTGYWDFGWTDPTNGPETASFVLSLTPTATPNLYSINSITGTFAGLAATGPNGYAGADNLFADSPYPADGNGIGFEAGGIPYNVYQSSFFGSPADYFNLSVTSSSTSIPPSTTPLPAGLPLFLSGMAVFGLLRRRRN